jgi:hypothetical protein
MLGSNERIELFHDTGDREADDAPAPRPHRVDDPPDDRPLVRIPTEQERHHANPWRPRPSVR